MSRLIICNWKQFPDTIGQAEAFISDFLKAIKKDGLEDTIKKNKIILLTPFIYTSQISQSIESIKDLVEIGAQDVSKFNQGAFTGEISSKMLKSVDVKYVLIGHSERRLNFKETNEDINLKINNCMHYGLKPIICIGENARIKTETSNSFRIKKIIFTQLNEIFKCIKEENLKDVHIAYEPIWSISSTKDRVDANPEDIEHMILNIRFWLDNRFGEKTSKQIKILYGGSINKSNIKNFQTTIIKDGFLIGKASTNVKELILAIKQLKTIK